jgi:hypothetical protein
MFDHISNGCDRSYVSRVYHFMASCFAICPLVLFDPPKAAAATQSLFTYFTENILKDPLEHLLHDKLRDIVCGLAQLDYKDVVVFRPLVYLVAHYCAEKGNNNAVASLSPDARLERLSKAFVVPESCSEALRNAVRNLRTFVLGEVIRQAVQSSSALQFTGGCKLWRRLIRETIRWYDTFVKFSRL